MMQMEAILHSKYEISREELHVLEEELKEVLEFSGSEEDFVQLCAERETFYVSVRSVYIQNLIDIENNIDPTE